MIGVPKVAWIPKEVAGIRLLDRTIAAVGLFLGAVPSFIPQDTDPTSVRKDVARTLKVPTLVEYAYPEAESEML